MTPFGFTEDQWLEAIREAEGILKTQARVGGTISYSELVSRLTTVELEARDPRLHQLLDRVWRNANEAGRGLLTVLVVYKDGDGRPGPGFFHLAEELGRDVSDREAFWVSEFARVCRDWAKVEAP